MALALFIAVVTTSEQRIDDLFVTGEWRSRAFSFAWDDGSASRSGDDHYQQAWAAGGGWRRGWGGSGSPHHLIAGLGLLGLREEFVGGNVTGALLRLETGYGFGLSDHLLITVLPVVDLGLARTSLAVGRSEPLILKGSIAELGLRTGLRWSPAQAWALSADVGWISGQERASGDGADLTIRRSGPLASLSLVWRLDSRPRSLE